MLSRLSANKVPAFLSLLAILVAITFQNCGPSEGISTQDYIDDYNAANRSADLGSTSPTPTPSMGSGGTLGVGGTVGTSPQLPNAANDPTDPCYGNPALATACKGGALYAGTLGTAKLMVTPGGCTDSANPICAGGVDTVTKSFVGTGGVQSDIPGIINVPENTRGTQSGDILTPLIVNDPNTAPDSGAHYCANMNYGGYSDWYLPSYDEMNYLMCKAQTNFYNSFWPAYSPGCAIYGGKTMELPGFYSPDSCASNSSCNYMTSSELNINNVNAVRIYIGVSNGRLKNALIPVRCIRKY